MCKLPLVALHLDILEALAVNDEYSRLTTLGSSLTFILGVVSKALFLLSKEPKPMIVTSVLLEDLNLNSKICPA